MFKITFWRTICIGGKSIDHPAISSSNLVPKISWLSGKHFHSLLQCDACFEILFRQCRLWWKHCGQILLNCRNNIQNGKRRKGKEGRCHSWRWDCPRRPFLWGEAQVSYGSVHDARIPEMKNSEIIKPAALDSFRWSLNRWLARNWQRKYTRCALLWPTSNLTRTLGSGALSLYLIKRW